MPQEVERYEGQEAQQSFVRKHDDRLWAYCLNQFKRRWAGKQRAIPVGVRHEGEMGWWFPAMWIADFIDEHGGSLQTARHPKSEAERIAYAERAVAGFSKRYGPQISTREAESWSLPVGSIISPDGVKYPDGSFETIADIRLRMGKYRPGARHNAAQQNLEDMLRVLHGRKAEEGGGVSPELAANPLTRRDWDAAA